MQAPHIDLTPQHISLLREILLSHIPDTQVLVFGSRVQGTARPFSDIDLALNTEHPIEPNILESLKDALSLSDLPFLVDIVELCRVTPEFRERVLKSSILLTGGGD